MKRLRTISLLMLVASVVILPALAAAQVDNFGKIDTVYADVAKINDNNWTITISCTNDESVVGLSVPLRMTAGMTKVVADSAIYTGGRVETFDYKGMRADTAIQCVTLGMIANLGPTHKILDAGSGRLVTIFVSSLDKKPIEKLDVDTTTTNPNNSLLVIASTVQGGATPDTIPIANREIIEIRPAFVAKQVD
ncbi:MAG TPA: hypothetical protein VJ983_04745 [candidate division Zixibacteria bacterium]|nr:hypothetical protein [candidate division Zixibacteria bacterium]